MTIDLRLPELGENVQSGDVVGVLVHEGDTIAANDGVIEVETEKAVVEVPCPFAGTVAKIHVRKGQTIKVGETLLTIESQPVKPEPASADLGAVEAVSEGVVPSAAAQAEMMATPIAAGPEARRVARELGVDLAHLHGTGKGGRITVEDVRAAATLKPQPVAVPQKPPAATGAVDAYGPVRRERLTAIRRTIAAQMSKSAAIIPHVTNFDDADITELEEMRKTVPAEYVGPGAKLTAMAFVLRAVAISLRKHAVLNASLDEDTQEIVFKDYVNLGVAVDTPRGLIVPVLRNADQMSVLHIARELTTLATRVRSAEFKLEELRGGTFTVSNLGAVGGLYSTPIINHPEVAILLVGRARWVAAFRGEDVERRMMMPLSLSYDHRVVDGAAAGRFLNDVVALLQSPAGLLLTN
ncbi:MAG: 2-oxo acid dehydrogenase subunit E2 [Planctomycetaceae bacterium]|nr:2-oxo acid dehydrogenase subunit E2 [Planctomycetaceae bacterium]